VTTRRAVTLVLAPDASSLDAVRAQLDDPRIPTPQTGAGETEWAARLHDRLSAGGTADATGVASWLAVQAVGRTTVVVVERRAADHAALWRTAADLAGYRDAALVTTVDGRVVVQPVTQTWQPPAPQLSRHRPVAPLDTARLWATDRIEEVGRRALRVLSR
jgi:hypothetical protein